MNIKRRMAWTIAALLLAGSGFVAGLVERTDTSNYEISIRAQRLSVEHVQQTLRDMVIPT